MPIAGTITEVNATLEGKPELVNNDPYNGGWMIKMTVANESELGSLLSSEAYAALVG